MEREPSPTESLAALEATRDLNAERLQRPKRYWTMLACMLSLYALMPYTRSWPAWLQYAAPLAAVFVIFAVSAWKQPSAVRKIRLSGAMTLQLIGFALSGGIIVGLSGALYAEHGWWWLPAAAAVLVFALVSAGGRAMDRSWARRASRGGN